MLKSLRSVLVCTLMGVLLSSPNFGFAAGLGTYDATPLWPLCGRITDAPPVGWTFGDDCPLIRAGDADFHDGPISSSFGPRQLVSGGFRYDFHRGIDIAVPIGTPMFAVADGKVIKAGNHTSFLDPVIEIRHFRPGFNSCGAGDGCYSTLYLHTNSWVVAPDDLVVKGQYIGTTGESSITGFDHLHFEVRDAHANDASSAWQRDCVHPLGLLPYHDTGTSNMTFTLENVDASDPHNPKVTARVVMPVGVELDLERVEAEVFERGPNDTLIPIVQPGDTPTGSTIEGTGYNVNPPWFSMNTWNRQWTYKDSISIPWEDFLMGGPFESPYENLLPNDYDPNVHMDAADPGDFQVGQFNGMSIAPEHYNANSANAEWAFTFEALEGVENADDLCIRVRAYDALGNASTYRTFNCPINNCPTVPTPGCINAGGASGSGQGKLGIKVRDGLVDGLNWSMNKGPASDPAHLGDPDLSDAPGYSWCLYDASAQTQPIMGTDIPSGTTCKGRPCWKSLGDKGFKYKDKLGGPGGIQSAKLSPRAEGGTKMKIKGKGIKLPNADIPVTLPLLAQLVVTDGSLSHCWETELTEAATNDPVKGVKAKGRSDR